MKNEAAAQLGKSGGLKKSEKKTAACRKNASKPRARYGTAVAYEYETVDGSKRFGVMIIKGQPPMNDDKYDEWLHAKLAEHWEVKSFPIVDMLQLSAITDKI